MIENKVWKTQIWRHVAEDGSICLCLEKMFGIFCPICAHTRKLKEYAAGEKDEKKNIE